MKNDIAKRIIDEVANQMHNCKYVLEDFAIVPNVFLIYLHKDNHAEIKPFLKTLRQQIKVRLDKELEKSGQKQSESLGVIKKLINVVVGSNIGSNYELNVKDEWDITFKVTEREILVGDKTFQISKGEVCVVANFSQEKDGSDDLGSELHTFVTIYKTEDEKSENHVVATARPLEEDFAEAIENLEEISQPSNSDALAILECKYTSGEKGETYEMTTDKIVIGRDPNADLVLMRASNKISRKHLEISFKEGIFFLKSFGIYGTMVNGKTVPRSETVKNNKTQDINKEVELPDKARIALAGGEVLLNFNKVIIQ